MRSTITRLAGMAIFFAAGMQAASAQEKLRDYTYFLNELVNLDGLPLIQDGVTSGHSTSAGKAPAFDPADNNFYSALGLQEAGGGKYVRIETTGEGVLAEMDGPGCIFRVWSGNPQGVIRFYLDGDTKPTYEFDFDKLMRGDIEPFNRPLVWQRRVAMGSEDTVPRPDVDARFWGIPFVDRDVSSQASVCYLPIPFAKACKVTVALLNEEGGFKGTPRTLYYSLGYKMYPKDWRIETFHLPLKAEYKTALEDVCRRWDACGDDPQPKKDAKTSERTFKIAPGKTAKILTLAGPATICQFSAKATSKDPDAGRNVVLRAFWDGEQQPSILTPIGDFFGRAVGDKEYRSLPLGMTGDMDYCYWRMPFRKGAVFTVQNQGSKEVTLTCRFAYVPGPVPEKAGYFHAKWRRESSCKLFDYPVIACEGGGGVFVGDLVGVDNLLKEWWGLGHEKMAVDGQKEPTVISTGADDYFGDAWGIRWFVNPFHGCPQNEGREQLMYRWHVSDSIPFSKSMRLVMENYSSAYETTQNGYTSVAFWYQMPGGKDFFPANLPSPAERRPSPKELVPYAVEAERILSDPSGATVVDDSPSHRYSWGRAVRPKGQTLQLAVPVEREAIYAIELFSGPGAPLPKNAYTLSYTGPSAGECFQLDEGSNRIIVKLSPSAPRDVTLDYITVTPTERKIAEKATVIQGVFRDDFSSYEQGTKGQPVWKAVSGKWKIQDGEYHQLLTPGYDYFASADAWVAGDYEVQTKIRLVDGEFAGGFLFNMPDRRSLNCCQMVRFNGHQTLWCGPFDSGGVFDLQNSVSAGLARSSREWVTLTIAVHNSSGTYDVAVEGKQVVKGLKLTYVPDAGQARCVALVSSTSHVAFDDVVLSPVKSPGK